MKHILALCLFVPLFASAQTYSLNAGWRFAKSPVSIPLVQAMPEIFSPGEKVLFLGDSITHGGRGGDLNHYLGHGYATEIAMRYLAYQPERKIEFANRGISGDTSAKILARWERDGATFIVNERGYDKAFGRGGRLTADHLSILCGVNDAGQGVAPETYAANLKEMIRRAREANPDIKLVLGEPFRHPQTDDPKFLQMQDAVAELAWTEKIPLVGYQRFFNEDLAPLNANPGYWSWDSIHPTYAAHMRMADYWLSTVADWQANGRSANTAIYPRAKLENDSYDWWTRHSRILREQKAMNPEIVFIGDSITHFWAGRESIGGEDASGSWKKAFGAWRTLNAGFGWDRTQNVLWRFDHGLLDGTQPKAVVLMIGTNNIGAHKAPANTPEEIFEGIVRICARIREKAPNATIVLSGILPRGERPNDPFRVGGAAVNARLVRWAETQKGLVYVAPPAGLVSPDGTISRRVMHDFCHPTPAGYDLWAEVLVPVLHGILIDRQYSRDFQEIQ